MKKILIPLIIILAAALVAVVYTIGRNRNDSDTLVLSGTVEAVDIDLAFKTPGRIVELNFDEGDAVSSGDTVSELSHVESDAKIKQIEDQISSARAQKESLEIERESARRNLEKISNLVSTGGATAAERDDLRDKVRGLDAAISAAQSSVMALRSQKEYISALRDEEYLISPIDGVVLLRAAEPGEVVSSAKTILRIANLEKLEIKVYLPEARLGQVVNGQKVSVEIDSFPGRRYDATVARISDKAEFTPKNVQTKDERVKTVFAVTVGTTSHGGVLKPGMPCDVVFDLKN